MFKNIMKKAIFIRVIVLFILVIVYDELIQSYHLQIISFFKGVQRMSSNYVQGGQVLHASAFKHALLSFKDLFDKCANYEVSLIKHKDLPVCNNTNEVVNKNRGMIS